VSGTSRHDGQMLIEVDYKVLIPTWLAMVSNIVGFG
jgi:hypothetical protein